MTTNINSNGKSLEMKYAEDTLNKHKILVSQQITQPSGLISRIVYNTTYDGNQTDTHSKTISISSNNKESVVNENYASAKNTFTTAEGRLLTSFYNKENRLTTSIQTGTLLPTTYEYNSKGKVVKETQGSRTTVYTYDTSGNIATITNPNGETTSYEYTTMERVGKVTHPNGTIEEYAYDFNGNMTRLITPTPSNFNFTYNGVDQRTALTSPLNYTTSYIYNKNRRLTSIVRPSGKTISNYYENDRLVRTDTPEGTTNYSYIFAEQIARITSGNESITYGYDGDLLTSFNQTGALNQTLSYTYNNDFLVTSSTYAGLTENYTYDNDGLLTSSGAFTITRDADNGYTTKVADATLTQTREYNNYAEITRVADNSFAYNLSQRDNTGTITQKIETLGGIDTTYDYSYDSRGRLTTVSKNSQIVEEYTYDNNGNRLSATVDVVTISAYYTPDDNLEVYGDNTYRYDADGQLTQKTTPEGTTTYVYTTKGTLKEVITPTETIEYVLNPLEQRVAKVVDGVITEKYLWADLTTLLAVYDANDNLVQRFNYTDSRMPISMTMNNETYYLHYDQVGTLRAITDQNHNIIKEITYDTFGNILSDTNPNFKIPFGFAGGLHDTDIGLVHFGYREYDPYTGKWTTKDPIDFSGGDTNLYGYVLGDPVNFVDPEGLTPDPRLNGRGVPTAMGGDGKGSAPGYGYGPFGGICGEQGSKSATWIPDLFPQSCQQHDDCYGTCAKTKLECDLNLADPYGWALRGPLSKQSQSAYDNAQGQCKCQ